MTIMFLFLGVVMLAAAYRGGMSTAKTCCDNCKNGEPCPADVDAFVEGRITARELAARNAETARLAGRVDG